MKALGGSEISGEPQKPSLTELGGFTPSTERGVGSMGWLAALQQSPAPSAGMERATCRTVSGC